MWIKTWISSRQQNLSVPYSLRVSWENIFQIKELTVSHWTGDFLSSGLQVGRSEFTNRNQNISNMMFWYIFHIELITDHLPSSRFLHSHRSDENVNHILMSLFIDDIWIFSLTSQCTQKNIFVCMQWLCFEFFSSPLGLTTDYNIFHPKATRCDQYRLRMILPWLCSPCMEWLGLSPAPCGSVCTSQSPFPSAATSKFAGTLSLFTIFPSQTIASGQGWWRGCAIHLKVPVGLFSGDKEPRYWEL